MCQYLTNGIDTSFETPKITQYGQDQTNFSLVFQFSLILTVFIKIICLKKMIYNDEEPVQ